MACITSPELTDLQIYMALENDADDEILIHLSRCPHCRNRAAQLALAQDRLQANLFRQYCPPPDSLRDYYFRLLAPASMADVAHHVSGCPHCTRELFVDYVSVAPRPEPNPAAPGLLEQVRLWVAELLDVGGGTLTPAYGLRQSDLGEGAERAWHYQVDGAQISLEVEPSFEHPEEEILVGLVTGLETDSMEAHLWRSGDLLATTPIDSTGSFEFPHIDLVPGRYELFLNGPTLQIHLPDLAFEQD